MSFFLNCDNVFIIHFCSVLVMNLILLLSPSISSVQFCQVCVLPELMYCVPIETLGFY